MLSIVGPHRRCTQGTSAPSGIPRTQCDARPSTKLATRATELAARLSLSDSTAANSDALHALALIDLIWVPEGGNALGRSIHVLRSAARLSDQPAPILADLAAAYVVRAEYTHNVRDLLEALETIMEALEHSQEDAAAWFNYSLICERLGLHSRARNAATRYLDIDSVSPWSEEVRARLARLEPAAQLALPTEKSVESEVVRFANASPQAARALGWERVLGDWARAVLGHDSLGAAAHLRLAKLLGDILTARGGDATLADAVAAIEARRSDRVATSVLAMSHAAYTDARASYLVPDYVAAHQAFDRIHQLQPASIPLREWATLYRAGAAISVGRADAADAALTGLLVEVDSLRFPALAGQLRWTFGVVKAWQGLHQDALALFNAAVPLFDRASEKQNAAAVHYLAASRKSALGDTRAAYELMHHAVLGLSRELPSIWLNNAYVLWAQEALADGFRRAPIEIQEEGLWVAVQLSLPVQESEARLSLVRLKSLSGNEPDAEIGSSLAIADSLVALLPRTTTREWMAADASLTRGQVLVDTDPALAVKLTHRAVDYFGRTNNVGKLLPALVFRADAWLALNRAPEAESDLRRALHLVRNQHNAITSLSFRAAYLDAMRTVFDRLAMLWIRNGRPNEALGVLEEGRASVMSLVASVARRAPVLPRAYTVEYALVGDTILAWTIHERAARLQRVVVDRKRFMTILDRVQARMELGASAPHMRSDLAELYEWLVGPLASQLGPSGTELTIVADGEIGRVPFAALYDVSTGRYFIEDHSLRFSNSISEIDVSPRPRSPRERVVLVADPSFDAQLYPELTRLSEAAAEVKDIAELYGAKDGIVEMVEPAHASKEQLRDSFSRGGIVHYAGHAVVDDERPERSYLVLTSVPGSPEVASRMMASDILDLDLRTVRLVVLSACQSSRPLPRRSGGFAGLAGAFLTAGSGGVVGTLWRVDDRVTRAIMVEFHRAYRASGNAPTALRSAQLGALRSVDADQSTPAAWAGFRYAGT